MSLFTELVRQEVSNPDSLVYPSRPHTEIRGCDHYPVACQSSVNHNASVNIFLRIISHCITDINHVCSRKDKVMVAWTRLKTLCNEIQPIDMVTTDHFEIGLVEGKFIVLYAADELQLFELILSIC